MVKFFNKTLWTIHLSEKPFITRKLLNGLRILVLTFRSFFENICTLRASALTYYTLLSLIPVAALAFAISKGFGLSGMLQNWLASVMKDQPIAAEKIIQYSQNMLDGAKGGVIAGVGAVTLLYTTIRLLMQIENSFNTIWGVRSGRSIIRKFSDYLSLILICPLIIALATGTSVFAGEHLSCVTDILPTFTGTENAFLIKMICLQLIPFVITVLLIMFLYLFIPNTKVKIPAALAGAVLASILYYLIQMAYFSLQFVVAHYNAIYGGFAAVPLFLLWLQLSWTVILFGAEYAFAWQNVSTFEGEAIGERLSPEKLFLSSLKITRLCAIHFDSELPPLTDSEISVRLEIPILRVRHVLQMLTDAKILSKIIDDDRGICYQIALPVERLTPVAIGRSLVESGVIHENYEPLYAQLSQLWDTAAKSPVNQPIYLIEIK